jgi:threonine/homoserine/homoserine lactone efflux protein
MTAVGGVLWLGMLLGVGAALSVGPIFVVILQQAATSGFPASLRVILWVIRSLERAVASAVAFLCLAVTLVARDVLPRLG